MLLQPSAVNYHKIYHDWTTHNEQHTEQDKFSAILQNGPLYILFKNSTLRLDKAWSQIIVLSLAFP